MVTTYRPKKAYFSPNRIQLTGKEILKECAEDRERALEAFKYFKGMVDSNPEDDKAKTEMVKCLDISLHANERKVKLLDSMIKLAMHQDKITPSKAKDAEDLSFEDLSFDDIKMGK
tara:strand:+ start:164 stop:511 length:348 start_codon:yes stop_codon:yes gene_type:complete